MRRNGRPRMNRIHPIQDVSLFPGGEGRGAYCKCGIETLSPQWGPAAEVLAPALTWQASQIRLSGISPSPHERYMKIESHTEKAHVQPSTFNL